MEAVGMIRVGRQQGPIESRGLAHLAGFVVGEGRLKDRLMVGWEALRQGGTRNCNSGPEPVSYSLIKP
jgi:hypothetical protein